MSTTVETKPAPPPRQPVADERVARRSLLSRLLTRPEVGALMGAIVIYIVFFAVAPPFRDLSSLSSVLYLSSTFGIPAVAVALLMIGGEFDLSAGVAVTSSALVASMFSYQFTANMWVGVLVSLVVALLVGFINGYLVVKTGIPSFLVTLGTFFMLRGLNLAITKQVTGNVGTNDVANIDGFSSAQKVFASSFNVGGVSIRITLLWWILFVDHRHVGPAAHPDRKLDLRGGWVGAQLACRRRAGQPGEDRPVHGGRLPGLVHRHAHPLRRTTPCSPASASATSSSTSSRRWSAAACSPAATARSSARPSARSSSAWRSSGIVYAGWNPDWFYFFLGALLLGAILLNNYVRRRAEAMR